MRDELPFDELCNNPSQFESSVVLLEPLETSGDEPQQWTGPACEKCNAPQLSDVVPICGNCGWYANLGIHVEVDREWEAYSGQPRQPAAPQLQKSHVGVWLDLMPRWGWVILGCTLAVVAESIVARVATPSEGTLRMQWSLIQLGLGVVLATFCHVFNFAVLATEDADFGILDLFLKPLKLWIRAVHRLPTRLWVANATACGIVAAAMSVLVIGALPYERLWDWGFEQPMKQDLMGAVIDRAKEIETRDQELEEAIGDFAGRAANEGEPVPQTPAKPREKADCVILGYNTDRDGRLDSLVLGVANRGRLTFAGRVKPEMSNEESSALVTELAASKTLQPFIRIESEATWVKPQFACRVTYGERLKNGQLRDVQWERLLGAMRSR